MNFGMIKIIGIVFVIGGFGFWGLEQAKGKRLRIEELNQLGLAINSLRKEINYLHTPLIQALIKAAENTNGAVANFFTQWAGTLQEHPGLKASEAWQSCRRYLPSHLTKEDRQVLMTLAKDIGMSRAEEQDRLLQYVEERLGTQEKSARDDMCSTAKLWAYGGFLAGITLVLLLL